MKANNSEDVNTTEAQNPKQLRLFEQPNHQTRSEQSEDSAKSPIQTATVSNIAQHEDNKGYKLTKLGWIPDEWEALSLNKVIRLESGQHLSPDEYTLESSDKNIPYFTGPTDFTNKVDHIQKWTGKGKKFGKSGHTLITVKGSGVGSLFKLRLREIALGRQLMSVNGINVTNSYLYFQLLTKEYYFQKLASGNMIPGLTRQDILYTVIPVPPLPEQQAIAACLSTWDKGIHTLSQLIEQKERQKKGLMQQLLTGKKRLPGFDGGWSEQKLGKFFKERKETGFDELPLLSVGEAGVYPQVESNKKDTSNADKSKYKRICQGDIGYNTMRMWQGRSALSQIEGIVSPAYTIVTPKPNADEQFFAYLFKLPLVVHKFFRNSQGLVSDTLNCKFKDFAIVKVNLPQTEEEQTAIAQVLQCADEEIDLLRQKLAQLKTQKKGLMQQLLTGKKRLITRGEATL